MWSGIFLLVVVALSIFFNRKNNPITEDDTEYEEDMLMNAKEEPNEEENVILCSNCHAYEATDEYNDKPVCDDCFEELDAEEVYDDEDEDEDGEEDEEYYDEVDDRDYGGGEINIFSLLIGIMVLGITVMIGGAILTSSGEAMEQSNNSSAGIEPVLQSFSAFGEWLPIMVIVAVGAMMLSVILRVFNSPYEGM